MKVEIRRKTSTTVSVAARTAVRLRFVPSLGSIVGPEGPPGADGVDGADGAPGANGAAGSKWYSGSGAPSGGTGAVDDFYINTANDDFYKKTGASTWTLQGNLKGSTGATGAGFSSIATGTVLGNNSGSSDVPSALSATAAATLLRGGTDYGKSLRLAAYPVTGREFRLEDYGVVASLDSSDVASNASAFNVANAANNVTAFNTVKAQMTDNDTAILPAGYTPFNASIKLRDNTTLRGRPGGVGSNMIQTALITAATPFLDCALGTTVEDIIFRPVDQLTTGNAIACGNIATGGGAAMENNVWRNLRSSLFSTGAFYAGFAVRGENGPDHYGSRSVKMDMIHAGAYKTYGFLFGGCTALRATSLYIVQNYTPTYDIYMFGTTGTNFNTTYYIEGGNLGDVNLSNTLSGMIIAGTIRNLAFDSTAASNTVLMGDWTGTYFDAGTNNLVLYAGGLYRGGKKFLDGGQRTGWFSFTGTTSRATFDTATVTTAQLAQRVKAIQEDLLALGLIGP